MSTHEMKAPENFRCNNISFNFSVRTSTFSISKKCHLQRLPLQKDEDHYFCDNKALSRVGRCGVYMHILWLYQYHNLVDWVAYCSHNA